MQKINPIEKPIKIGIISDIHGNYQNLRTALVHLGTQVQELVCLGDLVSDSSSENDKCIDLIRSLNIPTVIGQHDDTCFKVNQPEIYEESRTYLGQLPEIMRYQNILCVHDNPLPKARSGQGMWKNGSYIRVQQEAEMVFEDFIGFQEGINIVFVGHTHIPAIYSSTGEQQIQFGIPIQLKIDQNYIINPGSIGGAARGYKSTNSYLVIDFNSYQAVFHDLSALTLKSVYKSDVAENKMPLRSIIQWEQLETLSQGENSRAIRPNDIDGENAASTASHQIYYIRQKLAVCGYSGISTIDNFVTHHFDCHLQCASGFETWISDYARVKSIPFDDCKEIDGDIFRSATSWLIDAWRCGEKILISCAAGESRSVSIAIGFLVLSEGLSFEDACKEVFAVIPTAYPHPQTLSSVGSHCGFEMTYDRIKAIYETIPIPPLFPWPDEELKSAFKH